MTNGCGFKCAKATLFIFNFVFWVAALATLGAGIWMRVSPEFLERQGVAKLESDALSLSSGGLVLIAIAAVAVVLGFFGCCGTAKESQCMLGIYITSLFIIMFVQLVAAVCGIFALTLFRDAFEQKIESSMTENIREHYGEQKSVSEMWDFTQLEAKCCGANGPIDYKNSTWYNENTEQDQTSVPNSCCVSTDTLPRNRTQCQLEAEQLFDGETIKTGGELIQAGCYEVIKDSLMKYSKILIGISFGVSIIELFCFILGVFLCCNVGKYSYDYE